MKEIKFYEPEDKNGYLSNFAAYPLDLKSKIWPTSEHYYQSQKVVGTPFEEKIRMCKTPKEAFDMTRLPEFPVRKDWFEIRDDVMFEAAFAKFSQHEELRRRLIETGDHVLIEESPVDYYWGCGSDGTGSNVLGKILMALRKKLSEDS